MYDEYDCILFSIFNHFSYLFDYGGSVCETCCSNVILSLN